LIQISYNEFNDAINTIFFDGRFANSPVYIDLEDDVLKEISTELARSKIDIGAEDLQEEIGRSVFERLELDEQNIYKTFHKDLVKWNNNKKLVAPPFTGLLVVLSLASERMRREDGLNHDAREDSHGYVSDKNYYIRLAEVVCTDSGYREAIRALLSKSGRKTKEFWEALNEWLVLNDYKYGIPTAKSFGAWTYVSYAMSQSLVRDTDRQNLQKMFVTYGFSPHENISASEMRLCLSEWFEGNRASGWLVRMWSSESGARERIVATAIEELESWDGVQNQQLFGTEQSFQKMYWVAYGRRASPLAPVIISLYLSSKNLDLVGYDLCDDEDNDGCVYALKEQPGADFAFLASKNGKIDYSRFFNENITLSVMGVTKKLHHDPKPIIPLLKKENAPYYQEVSRVSLNVPHIVLCFSTWEERVQRHLEKNTDGKFSRIDSSHLVGVPEGWVLYQGVRIITVDKEVSNDLETLVPFVEGLSIDLLGGIRFNQNVWHGSNPPKIVSYGEEGMLPCEVRTDKDELEVFENGVIPRIFFTDAFNAGTRQFKITVKKYKKTLDRILLLKDADSPRFVPPQENLDNFGYNDHTKDGLLSGFSADSEIISDRFLQGYIFYGDEPVTYKNTNIFEFTMPSSIDFGNMSDSEEDFFVAQDSLRDKLEEEKIHACFSRGNHVWRVDSYDVHRDFRGHTYTTMPDDCKMVCSQCGARMLVSSFKRKRMFAKRKSVRGHRNVERRLNVRAKFVADLSDQDSFTFDINEILDALCYLGGGSLVSFQSVISSFTENPLEVYKAADILINMGFIDILRKNPFGNIYKWAMTPPCVVESNSGYYYLSGFRNQRMVGLLDERLRRDGDVVMRRRILGAPSLLYWDSSVDLHKILKGIKDPFGRSIQIVHRGVSSSIASMVSRFRDIKKYMTPIAVGDSIKTYFYRIEENKWVEREEISIPGAYKASIYGNTYFYFDGVDSYVGTHEVVKILAAREAGVYLHSYSSKNNEFTSVVGAEPPALLKRALIACSGIVPAKDGSQIKYTDVDYDTAAMVFNNLYG